MLDSRFGDAEIFPDREQRQIIIVRFHDEIGADSAQGVGSGLVIVIT